MKTKTYAIKQNGATIQYRSSCGDDQSEIPLLNKAFLEGAALDDMDFHDEDMRGMKLCNASMTGANLKNADLRGAELKGANLTNACLDEANLAGAAMDECIMLNATAKRASFKGASLMNANLLGTDFGGAMFTGAQTAGATFNGEMQSIQYIDNKMRKSSETIVALPKNEMETKLKYIKDRLVMCGLEEAYIHIDCDNGGSVDYTLGIRNGKIDRKNIENIDMNIAIKNKGFYLISGDLQGRVLGGYVGKLRSKDGNAKIYSSEDYDEFCDCKVTPGNVDEIVTAMIKMLNIVKDKMQFGEFIDERDGKKYKTIFINGVDDAKPRLRWNGILL